jgi:hypothetical protein
MGKSYKENKLRLIVQKSINNLPLELICSLQFLESLQNSGLAMAELVEV